jgi:hypothetical protein
MESWWRRERGKGEKKATGGGQQYEFRIADGSISLTTGFGLREKHETEILAPMAAFFFRQSAI